MCENIEKINWHLATESVNIPTKFSAQILANTRTMYNSLEDYVDPDDLIKVFQQIINAIQKKYLAIFEKMQINSRITAQR